MSINSIFIAAAAMLAMAPLSANAHMILKSPVPYGNPNNSPLDISGSDFPCKAVPYTVNTMNEWPVGSEQTLSFIGTAVHGGGSCQISVTTDKEPTKDSKWKVIYSIEGGCPVQAAGNLDQNGPSTDNSFNFTIPSELPNGVMTTAWTWFNKIGNREMYMNCAPINVSGGSDDTAAFDALPDMAVANIGDPSSCGDTVESKDFTFENPGKYGVAVGTGPFADLCSGQTSQANSFTGGAGGSGNADSGAGAAPAPSNTFLAKPPAAAPSATQPAATPPSVPGTESTFRIIKTVTASMPPLPSRTDGVFAPGAGSAIIPTGSFVPPSAALRPTGQIPTASVSPQPSPSVVPSPGGGGGSITDSGGEACSPDGAMVCSADRKMFGICNFGKVVMQGVASGTACQAGEIKKRGVRELLHRNQRTAV
ncbi:hypothetical protein G6011_09892 [Alternaria panax]|uniref:Lytic polysaccharide monooxygenase n=1 Tax=Alternaria panax TaxID=48097 RepID=A0AAD4FFX3_9PLEO|nr:hypothetical protein G6011_09892 [Alternaria panax]